MTLDGQSTDMDVAMELGFRVVKVSHDTFQYQRVNHKGQTVACAPTQPHAYLLWTTLVNTARALAAAVEGGEEGDGAQPSKSLAPQPS